MSSHQQKPHHSYARVLRPTTLFVTPACALEIWLPCRALVDLAILVSSLHGKWDSVRSQSAVAARRKISQEIWARTFTSTLPSRMPQRYCSAWVGPGGFSRRPPAVMRWDHLCPVFRPAGNSWWWVYHRTPSI